MCDCTKTIPISNIPNVIPDNCALIGCLSFEPRCLCIPLNIDSKISRIVMFRNKELRGDLILKNEKVFSTKFPSSPIQTVSFKKPTELANSMAKIVEDLSKTYDNLIVDVTTFTHESLVMLLRIIHLFHGNFKSILCVYVGADQYSPGMKAEDTWLSKGCKDVRNIDRKSVV